MLIMQDLVNSQVSMNFLRGIATWCYFDEFHVLLRDRLTASYCVAIWKMLRKKGCVPSALTQNVKDFLASPEIENIFENSDFLVLLSQAQGDRQIFSQTAWDQPPPAFLCDPYQFRRRAAVLREYHHPVC